MPDKKTSQENELLHGQIDGTEMIRVAKGGSNFYFKASEQLLWIISNLTGGGDVVGPSSSVNNRVAAFDGTTGKLLKDSGKLYTDLVTGPASVTDLQIAQFSGTSGKVIIGGVGIGPSNNQVPMNGANLTDNQIVEVFNSGGLKLKSVAKATGYNKAIGTTAGTVMAGDDSRVVGAVADIATLQSDLATVQGDLTTAQGQITVLETLAFDTLRFQVQPDSPWDGTVTNRDFTIPGTWPGTLADCEIEVFVDTYVNYQPTALTNQLVTMYSVSGVNLDVSAAAALGTPPLMGYVNIRRQYF